MSLWRRITASASLEGEQYVVVYAGNASTTDDDLNLIAYPFDSVTGFGDRILPSEFVQDAFDGPGRVAFSPAGGRIATTASLFIAEAGDFGLVSYDWDEGFGARATSGVKPRGPQSVAFHPDGDIVFVSHAENNSTSRLYAYNWSDASGFGGTRSVSSNIVNIAQSWQTISVSPNGDFVALARNGGSNLVIFPFDRSTGFGTAVEPLDGPSLTGDGAAVNLAWNNAGTYVALGCASDNSLQRLHIWQWNNATGTFGTKVAGIDIEPFFTAPSVGVYAVAFSPDDSAIVLSITVAGRQLQTYSWDNATGIFGSIINSITPLGSAQAPRSIRFNTSGNVLFASGGTQSVAPAYAYQWDSESGFGAQYDNPDNSGLGAQYNAFSIDYINFG